MLEHPTFTPSEVRKLYETPIDDSYYLDDRITKFNKATKTNLAMEGILNKTEGKGIVYKTPEYDLRLGVQFQLGVEKVVKTLESDIDITKFI